MNFKALIRDRIFWKHLGIALGSAVIFLWLVFFSLKIFTHHGRTYRVPDLTGLSYDEAKTIAERFHLVLILNDSTYVPGQKPGTIVLHNPKPTDRVKKGRKVFATINACSKPKVPMPNVTGVSFRQAQVSLELAGLSVGRMIYQPDPMRHYVLEQRYKGQTILPGTPIEKGESVDLILGQGVSGQTTIVPNVTGMTLEEAKKVLQTEYLNIGKINFDKTVKTFADSVNARVFRQYPASGYSIRQGYNADLWLTLDNSLSESIQ